MLAHYLAINVCHAGLVELGGEVQAAVQRVVDGDVSAALGSSGRLSWKERFQFSTRTGPSSRSASSSIAATAVS
jgi:hypothetical protein